MSKFRVGQNITIKTKEEIPYTLSYKHEQLYGKDAVIVLRIYKGHPYFRIDIDCENTDWHEECFKKRIKNKKNKE